MTLREAQSYATANNYVLVSVAIKADRIKFGALDLEAPTIEHDRVKASPVVCKVILTPRRLIYGTRMVPFESVEEIDAPPEVKMAMHKARRDMKFSEITMIEVPIPSSMPWKTTMDIRLDDIVWVNPQALVTAKDKKMTMKVDGEDMYFIPYHELYLKKAGDQVHVLNGWILCQLIEESEQWHKRAEKMGLHIPPIMKDNKYRDRFGVVTYAGTPTEYCLKDRYDDPHITVGSIVMFKWPINRRLEPGMKFFAKDESDLIVTRRANCEAIMK